MIITCFTVIIIMLPRNIKYVIFTSDRRISEINLVLYSIWLFFTFQIVVTYQECNYIELSFTYLMLFISFPFYLQINIPHISHRIVLIGLFIQLCCLSYFTFLTASHWPYTPDKVPNAHVVCHKHYEFFHVLTNRIVFLLLPIVMICCNFIMAWGCIFLLEKYPVIHFIQKNIYPSYIIKNSSHKDCAICLDTYIAKARIAELPCEHLFHDSCLRLWFATRLTCPLCLQEYEFVQI